MPRDRIWHGGNETMSNKIASKIGISDKQKFKECVKNNDFYQPLFVKIKPLGKCNLRCAKCNYWRRESHMLHPGLSYEKIISLVDELSTLGCRCIKLSGGEITLLERLPEVIKHIKSKGIICSITSNGLIIDDKLAEAIVSAGLDKITISIDSSNPEIHNKIVGMKGAWERSTNAIKNLVNYKEKLNSELRITISSVLTKVNYRDIDKMLDLLKELNVSRWDTISLVKGHLEDKSLAMEKEDIEIFDKKIMPLIVEKSQAYDITLVNPDPLRREIGETPEDVPKKIYSKIPCYVGWYSFLIHFNSMVALCCANKEFEIGNVQDNCLKDIINNEKSRLFRQRQKCANKPENCLKCMDEIKNNIALTNWLEDRDEDFKIS
jgi:MoaA/NifB/PqqE/SkfB family radical SAM enzyme